MQRDSWINRHKFRWEERQTWNKKKKACVREGD